jgi:hypothetical protein
LRVCARKEEVKVKVDVPAKLQVMSLAALPSSCFPLSEPTDKLATLRARAVKARVQAPFPLMEVAEFLPAWAQDVRTLFHRCVVASILSFCFHAG